MYVCSSGEKEPGRWIPQPRRLLARTRSRVEKNVKQKSQKNVKCRLEAACSDYIQPEKMFEVGWEGLFSNSKPELYKVVVFVVIPPTQ